MTRPKHTPGPWKAEYLRGVRNIIAANNESIMGDETYYPWVPENPLDWDLIAAAPELLEVLNAYFTDGTLGNHLKWIEKALAAIAKAEGRE